MQLGLKSVLTDAAVGDPAAQYRIGLMYYLGSRAGYNRAESMKWFQMAARQGDPDAAFILKVIHYLDLSANESN